MDLTKISLVQIAAMVGAVGTIVGAIITVDNRYVKHSELDDVKKELKISMDKLHQQILENEQLKEELGDNAKAAKVLAERNKQELLEIRERLSREVYKKAIRPAPAVIERQIIEENKSLEQ